MRRSTFSFASIAALAVVLLTTQHALALSPVQAEAEWIDVLSVGVDTNGLIVIVCRGIGEAHVADGTHRAPATGVVFKDGKIVSVSGREEYGVEEVTIGGDGEIILLSSETATEKASPHILPDGEYEVSGRLSHDPIRESSASGFRIRGGAMVNVRVGRS